MSNIQIIGAFLSTFIGIGIPLILVAYGGMFSEHSGIINLALEGIMIVGAMVGALICSQLNTIVRSGGMNAQVAMLIVVLGAGFAGALFSILLSFAAVKFNADQTIAGTAMNIIAPALFVIVAWAIQGKGQTQVMLPNWTKVTLTTLGFTGTVTGDVAKFFVAFTFYKLSYVTTLFALVLIPLSAFILYKTKFGLRLRSCGEHPQAAASLGINVGKMRYAGVSIGGFLAGIGGMAYLLVVSSSFDGQVAGYGFLALAVMIFGNWKPGRIILAGLFFSFFTTLSFMTSIIPWLPSFSNITNGSSLYLLMPYVMTLIILIFTSKRSQAPKAEGQPYDVASRS